MRKNPLLNYPIVVIGAGAAGLVIAIGAARSGKKVLLIEKANYGGDCTNFGCIPSKTLLEAAKHAHSLNPEFLGRFGIQASIEDFNAEKVFEHVQKTISYFVKHEDPKALKRMGVDTLTGLASFINENTLSVLNNDKTISHIQFKKAFICTGSKPLFPNIEGLHNVKFLTNESLFTLSSMPKSLGIIGGGAIGCEMAQAFTRLGSKVSLFEAGSSILSREETSLAEVLQTCLHSEGTNLHLGCRIQRVEKATEGVKLTYQDANSSQTLSSNVSELFVCVGREANFKSLHLEAAGIRYNPRGIKTNSYGETSQSNIYACGDVIEGPQFTHYAEYQARTLLKNLFIPSLFKSKIDKNIPLPRVVYTEPEFATIGLSKEQAFKKLGKASIHIYDMDLKHSDRAITALKIEGKLILITKKWSGKILGASILAPRAGELISTVSLAMSQGLSLRHLSQTIYPYPSYSRSLRKIADKYYQEIIIPYLLKWKKKLKL
jgi:pyruvate/2-oxoglutarate dehydrogenase complex dihydrolipoamide dehydrogenase (E3) component